jgi:ATP/maltotriose-dependent transcriptional regulator MalT
MVATSKTQLVATKILLPRCAPGLIDRSRLLDLMGQVQAKQVTVIQAGPGFGKTFPRSRLGGTTSEEW